MVTVYTGKTYILRDNDFVGVIQHMRDLGRRYNEDNYIELATELLGYTRALRDLGFDASAHIKDAHCNGFRFNEKEYELKYPWE